MTVVTTLDITDLTPAEYRSVLVTPLHNLFAPRLEELPGVVSSFPGAPA